MAIKLGYKKCLFCLDLRYGLFTFAVFTLICRFCAITTTFLHHYYSFRQFLAYDNPANILAGLLMILVPAAVNLPAWLCGSCGALFTALVGIVRKRAILLYPFMVILGAEMVMILICLLITLIVQGYTALLLYIPIVAIFDGYPLWLLICLHKEFQNHEKGRSPVAVEGVQYVSV